MIYVSDVHNTSFKDFQALSVGGQVELLPQCRELGN